MPLARERSTACKRARQHWRSSVLSRTLHAWAQVGLFEPILETALPDAALLFAWLLQQLQLSQLPAMKNAFVHVGHFCLVKWFI